MKKFALILLGLFLAAMTAAAIASAMHHHGDPVELLIAVGLGLGSWRSFRAAGRLAPASEASGRRPW